MRRARPIRVRWCPSVMCSGSPPSGFVMAATCSRSTRTDELVKVLARRAAQPQPGASSSGSTRRCNSPLLGPRASQGRGDAQGHALPDGSLRGAGRARARDPGLEENHLPVVPRASQGEERERAGEMSAPLARSLPPGARLLPDGASAAVMIAEDDDFLGAASQQQMASDIARLKADEQDVLLLSGNKTGVESAAPWHDE